MDWIEVPDVKAGSYSISSLYVAKIAEGVDPALMGVNANRRFARNSKLRFTTYIYNAATPPQLSMQIKVLHGTQAVITPPEIKVGTETLSLTARILHGGVSAEQPAGGKLRVGSDRKIRQPRPPQTQQSRFAVY